MYQPVGTILSKKQIFREAETLRFEAIRFRPLDGWILVGIGPAQKLLLFRGFYGKNLWKRSIF